MSLQKKDGKIQIRLGINFKLHLLASGILLLVWAIYPLRNGSHLGTANPFFLFTLFTTWGSLAVKAYVYHCHLDLIPKFFWLFDFLDVAVISCIYHLGYFPVNFLLILYFFLIFLSIRQFAPRETIYLTLLSLLGFGFNTVLLWPNLQTTGQPVAPVFAGFSVLMAVTSLGLSGIFTNLYAKSDLNLAKHLQQMLDEKEAVLREASLTHANLEEKYAFSYTLTLIQQSLLEEMDEANLLSRITDIIQGVVGSYSCAIFSIENDQSLKLSAFSGKELPAEISEIVKKEHSLVAKTIKTQTIQNEEAATAEERIFWAQQGINSLLAIPLSTKNNNLGVLLTTGAQSFSFNGDQQEQLMIITNQVSLALENSRLHKKTSLMAWHDSLTGLYNRNYLNIFLSVVENNTEKDLGCILFDLDLFKVVNDTYGHSTGDIVLKEFGAILAKHTSTRQIAVRYGGEEFMILGLNANTEDLFHLAQIIRRETAALNFSSNGEHFSITVSCGIAVGSGGFNEVFVQADTALYEAKRTGRNKAIIFDPNYKG